MKMKGILIILCFLPVIGIAQPLELKNNQSGVFSLGVRSTISTFNDHPDETTGLGMGGQFRLQVSDRVNTDWFFDYITSDNGTYAHRTDYHIGWSVLYYFSGEAFPKVKPFALAGHCFDYSRVMENGNNSNYLKRWSSAVQGGLGTHFNLSNRLDLTIMGQYMIHLGNHIDAHMHEGVVELHEEQGASKEGHLLFTIGVNYKIADLW